jgi:hypothetical protein
LDVSRRARKFANILFEQNWSVVLAKNANGGKAFLTIDHCEWDELRYENRSFMG